MTAAGSDRGGLQGGSAYKRFVVQLVITSGEKNARGGNLFIAVLRIAVRGGTHMIRLDGGGATRDKTNASLDAERQITDDVVGLAARAAQAMIEAVLAREWRTTNSELEKIRFRADVAIEEIYKEGPRLTCLSVEREARDLERCATDAVIAKERARTREALEEIEKGGGARALAARRDETDETLAIERHYADGTVILLRESEHALSVAQAELARRKQLFGMVSHELRNALHIISMNAQLLSAGVADRTQRVMAEDTREAAAQMGRLVNDLLDVAGVESGVFRVETRRGDLVALLEDARLRHAPLFRDRSIALVVDVGHATHLEATFDHDRLMQVISNILGNALKFTPPGGTVTMTAANLGCEVEVRIRDTGCGVESGAAKKVFGRFWQAEPNRGTGLGLGLYIAKCIIESHGGSIDVDTGASDTSGTTIRFTLPLSPTKETDARSFGVATNAG